jgi:hypothetical protein
MSALSGAAAGVLGLTALYGFAFYFIMAFALSVSTYFIYELLPKLNITN